MFRELEKLAPKWFREHGCAWSRSPPSAANDNFKGTPRERRNYMLGWVHEALEAMLWRMEQEGKLSRWTPPVKEVVPERERELAWK